MSGITPLLDTLLHQVLGKRVDLPVVKDLNQPVMPVVAAEAVPNVRGDSRLESRIPPPPLPAVLAGERSASAQVRPAAGAASPPASTSTVFSPAARTIADVLLRYPIQPSALAPAGALLSLDDGVPTAALLAARLQGSIDGSGLFYESHLARWCRGELPLQALAREPQMLQWRQSSGGESLAPRSLPGQSLFPNTQSAASGAFLGEVDAALPPQPAAVAVRGSESVVQRLPESVSAVPEVPGLVDEAPVAVLSKEPAALQEMLQSVVRHQLELLVTPALRWEGNVWAGVFMALLIQAPQDDSGRSVGWEQEGSAGDEGDAPWRVRMTLELTRHGALDVAMGLCGQRLTLTLGSDSEVLGERFARDRNWLQERLQECGFVDVSLRWVGGRLAAEETVDG